jgi:hypothetical protein
MHPPPPGVQVPTQSKITNFVFESRIALAPVNFEHTEAGVFESDVP